MKLENGNNIINGAYPLAHGSPTGLGGKIHAVIQQTKENLLAASVSSALPAHLLRLALNEAEALAWDASFPHLWFPLLAEEKTQEIAAWHAHQSAIYPGTTRLAVAA